MLKLVLIFAVLLAIALSTKGDVNNSDCLTANLAVGKPALQSSTESGGVASRAVDGVRNTDYNKGSCSHTHYGHRPWWRVDLRSYQKIKKVTLTTKRVHWERLRNIEIIVGNVDDPHYTSSSQAGNKLCAYHHGSFEYAAQTKDIVCTTPIWGRYVFVVIRGREYLSLCETEVYGIKGVGKRLPDDERFTANIAQSKGTKQSSTHAWPSKNAVDGNPDTCTHTNLDNHPWWRVDLGSRWTVKKVALINRLNGGYERLHHLEIRVGMVDSRPKWNSLCKYFPGVVRNGGLQMFTCDSPKSGRYVFVDLYNRQYLTLCEVQVYAIKQGWR